MRPPQGRRKWKVREGRRPPAPRAADEGRTPREDCNVKMRSRVTKGISLIRGKPVDGTNASWNVRNQTWLFP